jgi:hypothetical protein
VGDFWRKSPTLRASGIRGNHARRHLAVRRYPNLVIALNGRQHEARRPVNGPVAALRPIGKRDHPLDLRRVLFDKPHGNGQGAALAVARQGVGEGHAIQLNELIPPRAFHQTHKFALVEGWAELHSPL